MAQIAVAGDFHGELGWAIHALRTAKDAGASILLQVGDFGFSWPGRDRVRAADRLNREAEKLGVPIAFIRGNHDNFDDLTALPVEEEGYAKLRSMLWYIPDGGRFGWHGTSIGGLGGATSQDTAWRRAEEVKRRKSRTLWWPEEPVDRHAATRLAHDGPLDMLLTHEGPRIPTFDAIKTRQGSQDFMRSALIDQMIVADVRERTRPILHCFGHHHVRRSLLLPTEHPRHQRLEALGRDTDRLGNLILWDSTKLEMRNLYIQYGRQKALI